jgi:hypothetical protein
VALAAATAKNDGKVDVLIAEYRTGIEWVVDALIDRKAETVLIDGRSPGRTRSCTPRELSSRGLSTKPASTDSAAPLRHEPVHGRRFAGRGHGDQ